MTIAVPPFLAFFAGAPLVLLLPGKARRIALVAVAALALSLGFLLPEGTGWIVPFMDYEVVLFQADRLSLFTGYIFLLITFLATLYAAAFARPWLHAYALLYAGTSLGVIFAGDFITLLLFWEGMAITSTLLIWERGGDAVAAGYRYLLFHGLGGSLLFAGVALHFLETGNLRVGPLVGGWSSLLAVLGIGVNVGFIPLHTWLPDAYPRAHIASSVFLSVYTTKAAVYLIARSAPETELVAIMGGVMAVYGVSLALLQNNMRRLLSYHIVSQVGYMVAGVGIGTTAGINGGMAHVFNHILYKALLFMTVGAVIQATRQETMDRLGGLGRQMPWTAITFWIAAFSISGVPGFNGYVSKGMVVAASHDLLLQILLGIASFGTFLSFLKLGFFVFLRKGEATGHDPPLPLRVAQIGTAALCVAIGLFPALLFEILPHPNAYEPWTVEHLGEAALILAAAAVAFATVGRRLLAPHDPRLQDVDVAYRRLMGGLVALSRDLQRGFALVYNAFVAGVTGGGQAVRRLQTGDLNWNVVGLATILAALVLWLLWEVV
jgi:multicomponent Na+:H+ antiporter subunit D